MHGEAVENYLKSIYQLSRAGDGPAAPEATAGRVGTLELAQHLSVTPASASRMLQRLASLGLVDHEHYRGASLTPEGERVALEVIRHHRLLELYLAEALGMTWDRVHEEAEVLEHAISPELSELIAKKLGNPTHDPHGDPIPTASGEIEEPQTRSLAELGAGERGVFTRISDADPEMLRYLSARGIDRGVTIEVVGREPFGGPLTVRAGRREHALGGDLARAMRLEPA